MVFSPQRSGLSFEQLRLPYELEAGNNAQIMACHAVASNLDPAANQNLTARAFVIVPVGTPSLIREVIQMRE